MISLDDKKLKRAFIDQRGNAAKRQIDFLMSYSEWLDVWTQSGKLSKRGSRKGCYVMSRYNDVGPYKVGNVFIQLHANNIKDAHLGATRTAEQRKNISQAHVGLMLGVPKSDACKAAMSKPQELTTCPHCGKVGGYRTMPRWHFNNCKNFI